MAMKQMAKNSNLRLYPSEEEFLKIHSYDRALVFAEVSSDLETPVSAFLKLRGDGLQESKPCFLLESAESEQMWGRYSFLGFDPMTHLICEDGTLTIRDEEGRNEGRNVIEGNPVRKLFKIVESQRVLVPEDMHFAGGAVGYFGYDILPFIESVKWKERRSDFPEMQFIFPRIIVMFDHFRSRMRLCALVEVGKNAEERKVNYERAYGFVEQLAERLSRPLPVGMGIRLEETTKPQTVFCAQEVENPIVGDFSGNISDAFGLESLMCNSQGFSKALTLSVFSLPSVPNFSQELSNLPQKTKTVTLCHGIKKP